MKLAQTLKPAAAVGFIALSLTGTAHADDKFKLTDSLSVTGFIDMSWSSVDVEGVGTEQSSGLDQFEIDLNRMTVSFQRKLTWNTKTTELERKSTLNKLLFPTQYQKILV